MQIFDIGHLCAGIVIIWQQTDHFALYPLSFVSYIQLCMIQITSFWFGSSDFSLYYRRSFQFFLITTNYTAEIFVTRKVAISLRSTTLTIRLLSIVSKISAVWFHETAASYGSRLSVCVSSGTFWYGRASSQSAEIHQ